jgi:hypothetical protein
MLHGMPAEADCSPDLDKWDFLLTHPRVDGSGADFAAFCNICFALKSSDKF